MDHTTDIFRQAKKLAQPFRASLAEQLAGLLRNAPELTYEQVCREFEGNPMGVPTWELYERTRAFWRV